MSDFFNKLKKSIDKGTAIVGAKSTTLIESNKLKSEISTTQKVRKETLIELGTKVYTLSQEGDFSLDSVQDLISSITEANLKVAELEAQIVTIQEEEKAKLEEINAPDTVAEKVDDVIDVVSSEVEEAAEDLEEVVEESVDEVEEVIEEIKDNN